MYMLLNDKFEKFMIKFEENRVNLLILATVFFVSLFFYILYKSYNISKIKKDITVLPLIKASRNTETKIKHVIDTTDLEAKNFYRRINRNEDKSIKVIDNTKNDRYDLNKKINEIMEEEEGSRRNIKQDERVEENVVISDNIQEISINKTEKTVNQQFKDKQNFYRAQLVALANRQQADTFLQTTKNKYSNLLKNVEIFVSEVELKEKGTFYRVQVGFFRTKFEAENFCEAYLKNSNRGILSCIIVK